MKARSNFEEVRITSQLMVAWVKFRSSKFKLSRPALTWNLNWRRMEEHLKVEKSDMLKRSKSTTRSKWFLERLNWRAAQAFIKVHKRKSEVEGVIGKGKLNKMTIGKTALWVSHNLFKKMMSDANGRRRNFSVACSCGKVSFCGGQLRYGDLLLIKRLATTGPRIKYKSSLKGDSSNLQWSVVLRSSAIVGWKSYALMKYRC